jgi:hypothetical protein
MKAESQFWAQVAQQLNPGWTVEVAPGASLAGRHDFLYLVDASTSWLKAGAISVEATARASAQMASAGQKIRSDAPGAAAEALVMALAARGTPQESERARVALSMAMLAMTDTETFRQAHEHRQQLADRSLHWVYIVYRLQRGIFLGRPAAMALSHAGFAPAADIQSLIAAVTARDLDPAATTRVATQIRRDGPLLEAVARSH